MILDRFSFPGRWLLPGLALLLLAPALAAEEHDKHYHDDCRIEFSPKVLRCTGEWKHGDERGECRFRLVERELRCDCEGKPPYEPPDEPPDLGLDHFLCYEGRGEPRERRVDLIDQFHKEPKVQVLGAIAFCNPVHKKHEYGESKIMNPDHHLVGYKLLTEPDQTWTVLIHNQFTKGEEKLQVRQAQWLFVPTQKVRPKRHPKPEGLDHFKCYDVVEGREVGKKVTLKDQFGKYEVEVGRPMALCNPATKIHEGRETPVRNKRAHLVCYGVEQGFQGMVGFTNQLGDEVLSLRRIFGLCVPTAKQLMVEP